MNTASLGSPRAPSGPALPISLWTAQAVLAVAFGMAGLMKSTQPIAQLSEQLPWVTTMPEGIVRFIGTAELLGAIGLVLPAATRIKPWLTPLAAAGLVTVMVLAAAFHLTRGEVPGVVFNAVLGSMAAFVAWGRFRKAPISPRN